MNASTPSPDPAACASFADFWCRITGAQHITLTAITPDGPTTTETFLRGQMALRGFVERHQREGRNIYFQPNQTPARCNSKPAKADMVAARCRHADIDPDDKHFPFSEERDRLHRIVAILAADMVMPPTVIIDSGNGIQPLWAVSRELLNPEVLERVESENSAVESVLGAAGTHDVSRLLRLPGTVNFPNKAKQARGRSTTAARVIFQGGRTYTSEDAARLGEHLAGLLDGSGLIRRQPERAQAEESTSAGAQDGAEGDALMARLADALARDAVLARRWKGVAAGLKDDTRSTLAFALCGLLKRAGFSREDTFALLRRNQHTAPWCRDKGDANGARELHRLWEHTGMDGDTAAPWPAPDITLATEDTLPPPALPLHIFPEPWRRWIATAAEGAGAPLDYVACALLAVVGATIGNARWGSPWPGWSHPPVVNFACIGNPSAGKSPAINATTAPLADLAAALNADWEDRLREYRTERQIAKERRARWEAEVKEAVKQGLLPPPEPKDAREPDRPRKRRICSSDPTIEAARDLSAANARGLLLYRDELPGWIGSMDRYTNGAGGDRAFWLQAYDGGRWTADRVKDGDDGADIPHLTWGVVGGIQPDRMASLLMTGDDDGLASRFIYCWPAQPRDVPPRPAGRLPFALMPELRRLRELPMPEDEPVILPFTDDAVAMLQDWRRFERALEAEAHGLFLSWLGKLPGMAVRLAVVFAHLDWLVQPGGTPPPSLIDGDAAARAIGFLESYALPMARRAFGEAALPEAERDARRLARWYLRQRGPRPETLNARTLRRMPNGPGIPTAARINAALEELAELGWCRPAPGREGGQAGRQRGDWAMNPALRDVLP